MGDIANRVVCITGASSGIGKACAIEFAKLKCNLLLTARRKNRIDVLAQELMREHHIRVFTATLDVRNNNEVEKAFTSLPVEWKKIDILVNSAHTPFTPLQFERTTWEDYQHQINGTLKSAFNCCNAVLPLMKSRLVPLVANSPGLSAVNS